MVVVETPELDTCDIGMTKQMYLQMFMEAHRFFEAGFPETSTIRAMTERELRELYFATIAILTTSNDYHTVWRVHEVVVFELHKRIGLEILTDDFTFCSALATSRMKRVNKSSTLFLWLRKLSVVLRDHGDLLHTMVLRLLKLMQMHFANYCAGFTLQWLAQTAVLHDEEWYSSVVDNLRHQCRKELKDVTAWKALASLLRRRLDSYSAAHYNVLADWVSQALGSKVCHLTAYAYTDETESAYEDLDWLLSVECSVYTPYECVTGQGAALERVRTKLEELNLQLANLERNMEGPIFLSKRRFCETLQKVIHAQSVRLYTL